MKQKPENQNSTDLTVYPDAELSDKSLELLHSVIGVPSKSSTDDDVQDIINDVKTGNGDNTEPLQTEQPQRMKSFRLQESKPKQKPPPAPLPDIESKDRKAVTKTVFTVVFIVLIVAAAAFAGWYYWWTTHATFDHTLRPVVVLAGQTVTPDEFLYPSAEMERVTAEFQDPDFDPFAGLQYVHLTLFLGLRSTEAAAPLYVLVPRESIEHEFAEEGPVLRAIDMLLNPEVAANVPFDVHFTEAPLALEKYGVGEHTLNLVLNDAPFTVMLKISDTTPPVGLSVDHESIIGESVSPDDFVTALFDASGIESVKFEEEPNIFLTSGEEQVVNIIVTDNNGNTETISSTLTLILNDTPPVIDGVPELYEVKVDTQIDFLEGITAFDSFGRPLTVNVNDDEVNINALGTATAIIWAEDYTGNRTEAEYSIRFISVDPEEFFAQIDTILDSIFTDGMTDQQKALAIHNWVRTRLQKSSDASDSESLIEVALPALSERPADRRGNSKLYSAISSLMLTRAGVPNMLINRIDSADTPHRWVLINPDEKGWHHFDPFPTGMILGNLTAMFTEKEAEELTRRANYNFKIEDYYTFDTDAYPEIVKE